MPRMPDPTRLDFTLLDATATDADVDAAIALAVRDRLAAIVVGPALAKRAVGRGVEVISVVGYPLGLNKPTIKAIEATSLAKDGVAAVEITPRAASLIGGDVAALRQELLEIARGARAASPTIALHVRVDLDLPGFDRSRVAAIAQAIARGACDGVVFESSNLHALSDALAQSDPSLRRKAIAPGVEWIERLLASGADRVGVASAVRALSS